MTPPYEIPLKEVSESKEEPFGFVDGVSQPVIRGTYKGLRNADPIHLVEPGEFILGYPDNRGNMPPGPTLPAPADPRNQLPLVGAAGGFDKTVVENDRDFGFNGSFLVIRQLEQDVDGFQTYCRQQAHALAGPVAAALCHHRGIHRREADRPLEGRLVACAVSVRKPHRGRDKGKVGE